LPEPDNPLINTSCINRGRCQRAAEGNRPLVAPVAHEQGTEQSAERDTQWHDDQQHCGERQQRAQRLG
jgi:hypothetical protein